MALALVLGRNAAAADLPYVNFEGKQTHPIALSPDGLRLFSVNTPDNRLSVFDLANPALPRLMAEIPVGLEPVSVRAASADEVWVVNEVSDSVSIVSVSRGVVVETLKCGDEPADVIFAGNRAFVSLSRKNQVLIFDKTSRQLLATLPLQGNHPRALAVNANESKVYCAFTLSGNRTTTLPSNRAPRPPKPTNPSVTNDPPQVGLIISTQDPAWKDALAFTLPDNDVVEIDVGSLSVTRYFSGLGTLLFGLVVHPTRGELFVANTEALNLTRFEPNLRGHFVDNRLTRVSLSTGSVTAFDLNPGIDYKVLPNAQALANSLAHPTGLVLDGEGAFLFVAAFGSDRIAKVSLQGEVVQRFDLATGNPGSSQMKGPRGLVFHAPSKLLYCQNRIANTISVINTATGAVLRELASGSFDPTPQAIRRGRGFLYDARLSGNGLGSCASCHVDAEMDMIAWDLGDPAGSMTTIFTHSEKGDPIQFAEHPMKGPMTTQTLRGLAGQEPFHWRGDRPTFDHFNSAFSSLMGSAPLSGDDIQAFDDFVKSIRFQPNPNLNLDGSLPTSLDGGSPVTGQEVFTRVEFAPGLTCLSCHTAPPLSGAGGRVIMEPQQPMKIPPLRGVYQKLHFSATGPSLSGFGVAHDGAEPSIVSFLSNIGFGSFATDETKKRDLSAFVQCFDTGMAPAVGRTLTLTTTTLPAQAAEWTLLEDQARVGKIDLMGKGILGGKQRGIYFEAASRLYQTDSTGDGPFTRAALQAQLQSGDVFSLMGTPPGVGRRMGIDRNLDGILDGAVAPVSLSCLLTQPGMVIRWPTNATGFVLEYSTQLQPASWHPVTNQARVVDNSYEVSATPNQSARYYRLRAGQ